MSIISELVFFIESITFYLSMWFKIFWHKGLHIFWELFLSAFLFSEQNEKCFLLSSHGVWIIQINIIKVTSISIVIVSIFAFGLAFGLNRMSLLGKGWITVHPLNLLESIYRPFISSSDLNYLSAVLHEIPPLMLISIVRVNF